MPEQANTIGWVGCTPSGGDVTYDACAKFKEFTEKPLEADARRGPHSSSVTAPTARQSRMERCTYGRRRASAADASLHALPSVNEAIEIIGKHNETEQSVTATAFGCRVRLVARNLPYAVVGPFLEEVRR